MSATATDRRAAPPWTEVDWTPYVHDLALAHGTVRYVDYGSGPPLLLLHGLGCCWQWWLENLPTLGQSRRVVAVDIPGFGHSTPLPSPAEMPAQAEAMLALCDALGLDELTVAGHSMGGLVALAMVDAAPERIRRLILVNAGGVPMTELRLRAVIAVINASTGMLAKPAVNRAVVRRPRLRAAVSLTAVGSPTALSPQLAAEVVPLMAAPGTIDAVVASGRAVRDTHPEDVRCPVLLVWGDKDRIVPLHTAEAMAQRLADPTLVAVPGAGHTPQLQCPDEFNRRVLEFTASGEES